MDGFSVEPDGRAARWLVDGGDQIGRVGQAAVVPVSGDTFGPLLGGLPGALADAVTAVGDMVGALGAAMGDAGVALADAERAVIAGDEAAAVSLDWRHLA